MGGEVHLDIYDDRLAITSPGGMYSGQTVQDLLLEDISSDRRNPILADVMAQLDYMEKRGSGLKRICNETQKMESYKAERKPIFKSNASQFITIIYSMEYEKKDTVKPLQVGTKSGLSWDQVETKSGLSWEEVEKLFFALQQPKLMRELKEIYGWKNTTKFKTKYVEPLLDNRLVRMTIPSKPTSSKQRYYLTDLGKTLFANELNTNNTARNATDNINRLIESLNENEKRIAFELLKKHK